jgi:hypothetical protein
MEWTTIVSSSADLGIAYGNVETDFFSLVHGTVFTTAPTAAKLAVDTSLWGYEQIRRRKYYWLDKKKLMQRILRSTNIALFQKQREPKYELGAYVEGVFCIVGTRAAWIGCIGQGSMYEVRTNGERRILGYLNEKRHNEADSLGRERYQWPSQEDSMPLEKGDVVILATGAAATLSIGVFDEIANHQEDTKFIISRELPDSSWGIIILRK